MFVDVYPPLYQLAYLTGGRQLYTLKKELVDSGKMTYKQYHDAIMSLNEMPVEMIRAILTNQPLKEDFKTSWYFYKEQMKYVKALLFLLNDNLITRLYENQFRFVIRSSNISKCSK